jgi:GNAT superfamily N-acetyltransferase
MNGGQFSVTPYAALAHRDGLGGELDAIFFEASETRTFPSAEARAAFRERWLGRYLRHYPGEALLALARGQRVAGYLVGCLEDPAATGRFDDVQYFKDFCDLTRRFPAHLHINVAPEFRGHGLGSRLIEAFVRHARAAASSGVHVVTGKGMRNVGFYERNHFSICGETSVDGRSLVLLGRRLQP